MSKICRTFAAETENWLLKTDNLEFMKMYKQPQTEILSVNTEYMMQDLNVSINGGTPPGGGGMHAPKKGDIIE